MNDPNALATQSPKWLESMCNEGDYLDASRLYQFIDGQQVVLPIVRRKVAFGIFSSLESFPNSWGVGGAISTKPLNSAHLEAILRDLTAQKDSYFTIRPNPLLADTWRASIFDNIYTMPRLAHVLDLEGGFQYIWEKKFKSTTRTAVRKAEKSRLVVERDTTGKLVPVFYQLFEQSLERWGENQHEPLLLARARGHRRDPLSKFETIASCLGDAFHIWVAWLDGQPAASIIVLQGVNANYTRGAMNKELAGPTRANDLLHRLAIEEACEAGCRYYHMGETGESTSLASFKKNFGAEPVPYEQIFYERMPFTRLDRLVRNSVKRLIGFKDA